MAELNEEMFNERYDAKNASIEDHLQNGERILWHEKPKARAYVFSRVASLTPFALIWLLFDGFFITTLIGSGFLTKMPFFVVIILVVFFAVHLTPVWVWLSNFIRSYRTIKYTEYYITNKRVIVTNFPVEVTIKEVYIKDIMNVVLSHDGIDKISKVGDIKIEGKFSTMFLYDISQPEKIYSIFEKAKSAYSNLSKLPTYKICEYCNNRLDDNENKCPNCGAIYLKDDVVE